MRTAILLGASVIAGATIFALAWWTGSPEPPREAARTNDVATPAIPPPPPSARRPASAEAARELPITTGEPPRPRARRRPRGRARGARLRQDADRRALRARALTRLRGVDVLRRIDRVRHQPRRDLRIEERRLLRHHLARVGDGLHLRHLR